jgi:NAD(P)-dependent dehydrogenase (short-subunit alcohol dehydrogenase family)
MIAALQGRRLLVVGGANGIGRATTELCLAEGSRVAIVDREHWTTADDRAPPDAVLRANVRSTEEVDAAVEAASTALGGIDGVIYCAGIDLLATLEGTRDDDWQRIFDVNVSGAMRTCRAAVPHFPAQGGTIVLVASAAALRPLADRTAYCSSKAALVMFAKTLAVELAPRRIRVNALCPGAVETALFRTSFEKLPEPEAARREIEGRYALRRIADPEEIAASIVFLSSAASSYVTGVALAADGGRSFH